MSALAAKSIGTILAKVAWHLIRNWAHKSARKRGEWRGEWAQETPVEPEAAAQAGYPTARACRLVVNSMVNPRHWHHESGADYMPDTPLVTDGGSTPAIAREHCSKWADLEPFGRFTDAFYFHDAAYRDAGCWVRLSPTNPWEWMPLSRAQADTLLFQQMPSTGGRNGEANAVFRALRVFGGRAWAAHRRRETETKTARR
jgi:hypothetical protein